MPQDLARILRAFLFAFGNGIPRSLQAVVSPLRRFHM